MADLDSMNAQMDVNALVREEVVTDRKIGSIRVLTPITVDGKNYYTGYTKEQIRVAKKTNQNMSNVIISGQIMDEIMDKTYTISQNW